MSKDSLHYWNESNLAPTEVKRQHYVPEHYLRPFADSSDMIRGVDLESGNEFRTSVSNAAVVGGFNNVRVGDIVLSTEGWLQRIEDRAAPLIKRLIEDPSHVNSLSGDEQMCFARFFAAMHFRVPAFRQYAKDLDLSIVSEAKKIGKSWLTNNHDPESAERIWAEWEQKPDEWWLSQREPLNMSGLAASMLSEVQGFANLLWGMSWRVGHVPLRRRLYTSDNPASGYLRPIRPWWEGGSFAAHTYYIPLSPTVLLKIDPRSYRVRQQVPVPGERIYKDFSDWHVAMARNIMSVTATRFLYGDGPTNGREAARRELGDYEQRVSAVAKERQSARQRMKGFKNRLIGVPR